MLLFLLILQTTAIFDSVNSSISVGHHFLWKWINVSQTPFFFFFFFFQNYFKTFPNHECRTGDRRSVLTELIQFM